MKSSPYVYFPLHMDRHRHDYMQQDSIFLCPDNLCQNDTVLYSDHLGLDHGKTDMCLFCYKLSETCYTILYCFIGKKCQTLKYFLYIYGHFQKYFHMQSFELGYKLFYKPIFCTRKNAIPFISN